MLQSNTQRKTGTRRSTPSASLTGPETPDTRGKKRLSNLFRGATAMDDRQLDRITIRKYPNRRLYDTTNSRYVNLRQIAELIKEGHTVEVVDSSTGEDLTKVVLTQIILEEEKGQRSLLPNEFLHEIIKYGESAYGEFFRQFLSSGLDAYREAQHQMEAAFRGWFPAWPVFPSPGGEGERGELKTRIAELERRLAEAEARGADSK